ncbi:Histone-lysine N-methyltransferase PRDM9 [Araneus ventricosus]|uniref:Histone-lysine N-methyltransferase PRDM9 n=1 Tax=Araneus ventricosus TaxID=182803 RepID=A0A4Y2L373_ARAVE|nr:Histone-lysine N-methyltransferase PRDM9 [Araneus ventricosus]
MDAKHDETKEKLTGNTNDSSGNIIPAAQQNYIEESKEMNSLLTENDKQIPFTPAAKRRRKHSMFAGISTNAQHEHSLDTSFSVSTFQVQAREVKMKENASFKGTSETFEPATNSESEVRGIYKRKSSPTRDDHQQNNCRSNVSTLCFAASSEKWESLPDERNWCSLNNGEQFYSDSKEGTSQKTFSKSKNTSEASTSLANSAFSIENRELDKKMFEVSEDLTDRPISPETDLIVPSRNGDEDATIKQHLEFMKDADAVEGSSTIRPDSIRPGGKKPHVSYLCPKTFKEKSHLVSHLQTHTGEKPFVCDICGKEFSAKGNFDTHYKIHTGEKPFVCDICGNEFTTKRNLGKHYRTHTGEKPYVCDICRKGFTQKEHFDKHYRTHTGEKPFVCDICRKGFTQKEHFDRHYRTHTGEKPFVCNICGKGFSDRSSLNKHVPTHEGGKRFKCAVCGKTFGRNDSRNRHYKEKH